jgi:hypothetical protein
MNRIVSAGLVIGSLAALACNAPINFALSTEPTPTATLAITDTPLPTATLDITLTPRPVRPDDDPTPTHTPTPESVSLEGVTLGISDMPSGFVSFKDEVLDDLYDEVDGAYFYEVEDIFGYGIEFDEGGELIFGYPVIFPTDDPFSESADPDDQVDQGLRDITEFFGGRELTDEGELTRLGGIGEEAVGYYTEAVSANDEAFRVEVIAFRRGTAGAYMYHLFPVGHRPDTSTSDLAFLLDARLEEALTQ